MNTSLGSRRVLVPSIHLAPLVLGGLLFTSFAAGAVLTSDLTTGRLAIPEAGGLGADSVTVTAPGEVGG